MRKMGVMLAAVVCGIGAWTSTASAAAIHVAGGFPAGCKSVSYTGDGGYFSQGSFYWEPGDDATVTANWCYAGGKITSHSVTYTTNIPAAQEPNLTLSGALTPNGRVFNLVLSGNYLSGDINNVAELVISGQLTARGFHHFVDGSAAGG